MKLYLDENIPHIIAYELRKRGLDVISVNDAKTRGQSDKEQLDFAIKEKRTFVTYDIADFLETIKEYISKGKEHYGIILVSNKSIPQGNIGKFVRAIEKIVSETYKEKDYFKNKVVYLAG